MVDVEQKEYKSFQLSSEGEGVAKDGSHEAVVMFTWLWKNHIINNYGMFCFRNCGGWCGVHQETEKFASGA